MITLSYENVMAILALFTALCVSGGWLIKIVRAARKPADDVNTRLSNDNKRITDLEEEMVALTKAQPLILRTLYVICEELKRGNDADGRISKQQEEINEFLFER